MLGLAGQATSPSSPRLSSNGDDRVFAPDRRGAISVPTAIAAQAPAQRSASALAKASTQRLADGSPVHSFRSLLADLATLTKNTVRVPNGTATFDKLANSTPRQERALRLLNLRPTLWPADASHP